MIKSVN